MSNDGFDNPKHVTVSGLRPSKSSPMTMATEGSESDSDTGADNRLPLPKTRIEPSVRQFHSDTRFPQRKKHKKDTATPTLQPSSIDKFIAGIWRQVHSPVTLSVSFPVRFPIRLSRSDLLSLTEGQDRTPEFSIRTGVSQTVCVKFLYLGRVPQNILMQCL